MDGVGGGGGGGGGVVGAHGRVKALRQSFIMIFLKKHICNVALNLRWRYGYVLVS